MVVTTVNYERTTMRLTIELERATDMTEKTWFSHCLEIDCVSQGSSPQDAIVMVAEAIDMMVCDEIAALESSGQIENPGWERAFGNIADEVARRDAAPEVPFSAPTFPVASTETKDRDSVAALESEVEQLRMLVQTLKFHTEENAQLRSVCVDQAEQIADLRAALSVSDRPRAVPPRHRWRTKPPTPDEVTECQWWWNKPAGGVPHVLQLDRAPDSGLIFDAGESTSGACPPPFDPSDWPGEWAPCMTPDDVTARVSRIAEAGRRLVMSHVEKVKALRSQLALETATLELACVADVHAQVTVAEACQLAASADSVREAFESGFAIGLERGHDTELVRAEVTHETVREDFAVCERALKDHMTGLAERVGRR
jgi:predicted RNase H-like HicB family nuclease